MHSLNLHLFLCVAAFPLALLGQSNFSWDGEPLTPDANYGPANAIWDSSTITWISGNTVTGTADKAWENGINNIAQFKSGTNGTATHPTPSTFTLTLGENITANNIDIGGSFAPAFTITDGGSNHTLTVNILSPNNSTHPLTIDAVIAGTGLTKQNGGTAILNKANIYTGSTNIITGTLVAKHSGAYSSGTVNVNGTAKAQLNGVSVANHFNLNSSNASGALELVGAATLAGNITVSSASTIRQATAGSLNTFNGNFNLTGGPLTINGGNSSFHGTLAGSQNLTISSGTTKLQLSGNTHTGDFIQNAGTIELNTTGGNSIEGNIILNGNTSLQWLQANQIANTADIVVNAGSISTGNRADTIGNLTFLSTSAGTSTFSGLHVSNTFTLHHSGIHDLVNSGGVFFSKKAVVSGGARLSLGANSGNSTWNVGTDGLEMNTITIQFGSLGGTPTAAVNLSGNVTGNGTNTFTAPNNASSRVIDLGGTARSFDIQSGITTVDNFVALQNGSLIKNGTGILRINSGNSTYTGGTTVNQGNLMVGNGIGGSAGSATGTGAVTIGATGLVTGHGKIGGPVTISGTLSPGTDTSKSLFGLGTLIAENTLSFQSGSNLILEFLSASTSNASYATDPSLLSANPSAGTQQDFLKVNADLSLNSNSNITLDLTNFTLQSGDVLDLFDFQTLLLNGFNPSQQISVLGSMQGLIFDTSKFQDFGVLIAVVPEPSQTLLKFAALTALLFRRQRRK